MSVRYARFAYELAAIMLPYMPMICLVAVGGSALQTHGRFGPTAASPIILNLLMIAAMFGLLPAALAGSVDPAMHLRVVAIAVVVAGIAQAAWTLALLRRLRLVFALRDAMSRASVRATLLAAGPMMLGLGVLQINIVIDGLIASWPSIVGPRILGFDYPLSEGALTAITNASRLYEFPLGVFGISIATAIFPLLSRQNNDLPAFAASLRRGLRLTVFIGLPASVGLMLVAREAVGVLFQRGAFDAADTVRVAWVLVGFAPAIWAYQSVHVLTRGFYALKEPATAVRIAVSMVALNLCLNIALIFTPLKEAGLAWSTAICAVLQATLLARALARRISVGGPETHLVDREVAASWARTGFASMALAGAVLASGYFLPGGFATRDMALSLAVKVTVGAAAYLVAARLLAMPELAWSLPRRLGGTR
jgi:putative peptidoglycan lipid II flippase